MQNYTLKEIDGRIILQRVDVAAGFFGRAVGLLGRSSLPPSTGLEIATSSIHTFFMRFALDLVYLDSEKRVLKVVRAIKPWRISCCSGATLVIECAAGELPEWLQEGQRLALVQN